MFPFRHNDNASGCQSGNTLRPCYPTMLDTSASGVRSQTVLLVIHRAKVWKITDPFPTTGEKFLGTLHLRGTSTPNPSHPNFCLHRKDAAFARALWDLFLSVLFCHPLSDGSTKEVVSFSWKVGSSGHFYLYTKPNLEINVKYSKELDWVPGPCPSYFSSFLDGNQNHASGSCPAWGLLLRAQLACFHSWPRGIEACQQHLVYVCISEVWFRVGSYSKHACCILHLLCDSIWSNSSARSSGCDI